MASRRLAGGAPTAMPASVTQGAILKDVGRRAALIGLALVGLIAGHGAAASAPAVVLWNGAATGMSVDQVYALFGGAKPETGQVL